MTHYTKSNGQLIAIADMAPPYLANAVAKLEREADPERAAELAAMQARLAELETPILEEAEQ